MDIACPNCAATYELDESTVGPKGRKVRCTACGEVWRAMPLEMAYEPPPEIVEPVVAEPEAKTTDEAIDTITDATAKESAEGAVTDMTVPSDGATATDPPAVTAEPDAATPPPRGARLVKDKGGRVAKASVLRSIANWRVVTVAGTALVLTAGFLEREAVVRLLPQTAKLYAAVGVPVNLRGIEIRNVKSRLIVDNDEPVLVVDGDLVNVADRKVDVPRLHFALLGPDGRQVYVWSAQADRANLQPGETLNFRRRLAAPPAEAKNVSVRFVTRSDITAGIR